MFSIASMVPKLASKAASLVNGLDSEGHFLAFDNAAQPLRSFSKQQEPQQDLQLAYQQQRLHPSQPQEEPNQREPMSPSSSLSAPQNGLGRYSSSIPCSETSQNHTQGTEGVQLAGELNQTQQLSLGGQAEAATDDRAEQTYPQPGRLEIQNIENSILPKRNVSQSFYRTPSSSSSSSSTGMETASFVSESVSRSISSSPKLTPRQMSLRGARKRLSDSGSNAATQSLASQSIRSTNPPLSLDNNSDNAITTRNNDIALPEGYPTSATGYSGLDNLSQIGGQTQYPTIESMGTSPPLLKPNQGKYRTTMSKSQPVILEKSQLTELDPLSSWQNKNDGASVENNSRSYKRRAKSLQESTAPGKISGGVAKRTRSSNAVNTKKPLGQDAEKGNQGSTRRAKVGPARMQEERSHYAPKGLFSVTGDEYALKKVGLTNILDITWTVESYRTTMTIPPVDPDKLPEEWNCNECRAKLHPPKPNAPGIFKHLLDNIERANPKSFELPADIRSFFKGVEANSDGEYVETLDYKPSGGPRYRKRRDASSIIVEDPFEPNDGDIEIIEEQQDDMGSKPSRIRLNNGPAQQPISNSSSVHVGGEENKERGRRGGGGAGARGNGKEEERGKVESQDGSMLHNLEILAAAVMAFEGMEDEENTDKEKRDLMTRTKNSSYEEVQDAVLRQLKDTEEREEYLRFRSLQRVIRENGLEPSVVQWGGFSV
ncbi:hypothetical protein BGZ46_007752 [Entomortierella lignicola]|nr:hypothetical protein BGZ46_007752 [Entomortierella lignicola]